MVLQINKSQTHIHSKYKLNKISLNVKLNTYLGIKNIQLKVKQNA